MPLPLPNLDTRQWADLVEEGRALVPRYAARWTDHNVHDPGITLIELFAWMVEADIYRTNHISLRSRRKFLRLIGFPPHPPQPACVVLSFILESGLPASLLTPAGTTIRATVGAMQLPFRTKADLLVIDSSIVAVQTTDGTTFIDQTRTEQGRFGFSPWGLDPPLTPNTDPEKQPALYLGFKNEFPINGKVSFWFHFAGRRSDEGERRRLQQEIDNRKLLCVPRSGTVKCPPLEITDADCQTDESVKTAGKPSVDSVQTLRHHSVRTAWDYFDGADWQQLKGEQRQVVDETRGFTLDGPVTVKLPKAMKKAPAFGVIKDELVKLKRFFYLRCRLEKGPLDYAPTILSIELNATQAEQAASAQSTFEIRPGVKPTLSQTPVVGAVGHVNMSFDEQGAIKTLAFTPEGEGPLARVLAYQEAKSTVPGSLILTLAFLGWASGLPYQSFVLPNAPIAWGRVRLWTITNGVAEEWVQVSDLDASGRTDSHFTLEATSGEIAVGDGERGRVVPEDSAILVSYDYCSASSGNLSTDSSWQISAADNPLNQALLGTVGLEVQDVLEHMGAIRNSRPAIEGLDEEELDHAAGRAAEFLWAHERLLELTSPGGVQSLDCLDPERVLARAAPQRATTLLDYERLALDVPGAPVARARAWSGLDAYLPCVKAPGTVVVTIVPWLPAEKPEPSPQLLAAVKQYLDRRRLVGTRLLTIGPSYLQVSVRATIATRTGSRADRVVEDVVAALDAFLNPLRGGPAGRGWPFGRDVYRSEILEVIDKTSGVDHVEDLELVGGSGEPQCGNLCVGPLMLVTPGKHDIKTVFDRGSNGRAKL